MAQGRELTYFLGANTPRGFHSLYDGYVDTGAGDFLWVLKGGPGCGKSGFMRRIGQAAAAAGLDVERILCSGDPQSLDGVYVPALRAAWVDGTAPHILEPPFPGAGGAYLDLGKYYDATALRPRLGELSELNARYREKYREAYGILAALPAVDAGLRGGLVMPEDLSAVRRRAESAARRALPPRRDRTGRRKLRFLSAFGCEGFVFLPNTAETLCGKLSLLDNGLGLADAYLQVFAAVAERRGWDTVCCPDPLAPERLEAVLVPEAGLGCVAARPDVTWKNAQTRRVRLDAIPDAERLRALCGQLRAQAQTALKDAKSLHDALEAVYNPHVDFDGVWREADEHVRTLLGG